MHKDALLAHQASEAARKQGKFWEYHDKLFTDTRKLKRENLLQYAQDLNLDMERFEKDLMDLDNKKVIDADTKEAITLGATGTPAFFVNGRYLSGAQPFEKFAALINEELEKKKLPVPAEAKVQ